MRSLNFSGRSIREPCIDIVYTLYTLHRMTTLNVRLEPMMKEKAGKTLASLGLDMSSAVKLFLHQVVVDQGLPSKPTRRTPKEIRAEWNREVSEALRSGRRYRSAASLLRDMER